jgi:membrane protein implicated in regulation of membrane protease activity
MKTHSPRAERCSRERAESEQLMLWPVLDFVGFLVLTALVIVLGTQSTRRYEQAQEHTSATPRRRSVNRYRTLG